MLSTMRVRLVLFFGSALLLPAQTTTQPPQTATPMLTNAAAQLAARISSLLPRHASALLEAQNLSALSPGEWSNFRSLLQDQLRKAGVALEATPPDPRVRVTLSDDARGLLFVAEVFTGDSRQIAMLPWALPAVQSNPRLHISKKLLFTQPEPILDTLLLDSASLLLVLSTEKVAAYRLMGDKWTASATASLVLPRPMPRDPRGRMKSTADGFKIYLPAATCQGTYMPELRLTCANGTELWPDAPVRWVADRNTLEGEEMKTPFFSSANGIFAMTDGRVQERSGQPVAGAEGWGSDIAPLDNPCGSDALLLATSANPDRDELRVYEIANSQALLASDALPLPGPVTALWPADQSATLVVHNLQTGEYEASRLALACTE